jgi:hypothetical protein
MDMLISYERPQTVCALRIIHIDAESMACFVDIQLLTWAKAYCSITLMDILWTDEFNSMPITN